MRCARRSASPAAGLLAGPVGLDCRCRPLRVPVAGLRARAALRTQTASLHRAGTWGALGGKRQAAGERQEAPGAWGQDQHCAGVARVAASEGASLQKMSEARVLSRGRPMPQPGTDSASLVLRLATCGGYGPPRVAGEQPRTALFPFFPSCNVKSEGDRSRAHAASCRQPVSVPGSASAPVCSLRPFPPLLQAGETETEEEARAQGARKRAGELARPQSHVVRFADLPPLVERLSFDAKRTDFCLSRRRRLRSRSRQRGSSFSGSSTLSVGGLRMRRRCLSTRRALPRPPRGGGRRVPR